jgi:pepF/M3 family oligoendopeptidase
MSCSYEWDLNQLYTSLDSKEYKKDKEEVKSLIQKEISLAENFKKESIEEYLKCEERLSVLLTLMFSYSSLKTSTNVNDMESYGEMASLQMILQDGVKAEVAFNHFLKDIDIDVLVKDNDFLKNYKYLLQKAKVKLLHMLSEKEEVLYSKLRMVSSDGWSALQSKLTSNLSIKVEGFKEAMPLSSVRGLAYDKDPIVRKNAYLAELDGYQSIKDAVAMGLNNIKREADIMCSLRGYNSILDMALKKNHMKKETLDAIIEAIKEELPKFREYFKAKGKALGHKNGLPFYDLFAPMGNLTKTYTYEEAESEVLDVYNSFSNHLYEMGYKAFHEGWIDALPHEGKVGGAFCSGITSIGESRVLTNFTGQMSDIQTLAHEIGHAYHNEVLKDSLPLNQDYPMQLAETASILCQTLMRKKLIEETKDRLEKTVVENSLQEDTQCVVDILSRYLFENMVANEDVSKPLSASDMCEFMIKAQKESYGDGLDSNYLHPYMWLCKSHYYSASNGFYNWPYAFGLLYAKGLYAKYMENKDEFVKNYDQMLKNTCIMDAEDVALSMGIDITKKEFWISSLKTIEEDIELFKELLK